MEKREEKGRGGPAPRYFGVEPALPGVVTTKSACLTDGAVVC